MEITTDRGHALCLGDDGWVDWRCGHGDRTMTSIAHEVLDRRLAFVIASSDAHDRTSYLARPGLTYLRSADREASTLLQAIRQGRAFLS